MSINYHNHDVAIRGQEAIKRIRQSASTQSKGDLKNQTADKMSKIRCGVSGDINIQSTETDQTIMKKDKHPPINSYLADEKTAASFELGFVKAAMMAGLTKGEATDLYKKAIFGVGPYPSAKESFVPSPAYNAADGMMSKLFPNQHPAEQEQAMLSNARQGGNVALGGSLMGSLAGGAGGGLAGAGLGGALGAMTGSKEKGTRGRNAAIGAAALGIPGAVLGGGIGGNFGGRAAMQSALHPLEEHLHHLLAKMQSQGQ